jgi:soluble lytic murein transglycosylase-like protein
MNSKSTPADPQSKTLSAIEQSVYLQTKSVGVQRSAQANSIAQQRASFLRQAAAASPSFLPPFEEPAPIAQIAGIPAATPDPAKLAARSPVMATLERMKRMDESSFLLPWDSPEPMTMPNVRVPTTACPALEDDEIAKLTEDAAQKNSISAELLAAVMRQESGFHPCAVSTAGAMGLMQLMPDTAQSLGVADPFAPDQNVEGGARLLKQLLDRYHGDRRLALSAYNAGASRVDQADGVPDIPETQEYVRRILEALGEP